MATNQFRRSRGRTRLLFGGGALIACLITALAITFVRSALANPATANLPGWRQVCNNCYNHAKNEKSVFFNQPGGGVPKPITCAKLCDKAKADGLMNVAWMVGQPPPNCPTGQCLVAKAVRPDGRDYHWYRQNADGTWSHKPGQTPARTTDAAGAAIVDPATANRGAYTTFCGYMCYDPNNPPMRHGVPGWQPNPSCARVYSLERTGTADPSITLVDGPLTQLFAHLPSFQVSVPEPNWPDPTQAPFVGFGVVPGADQTGLPAYMRVFQGVVAVYNSHEGQVINYFADDHGLEPFLASQFAQTQFLRLDNGVVGDGHLDIAVDAYGAWAQPFAGGSGPNDDHFDPPGPVGPLQVAFTSGCFLFVGNTQRELLSDSSDWQTVLGFASDTSLNRAVTRPLRGSQEVDEGRYNIADSSFVVTGGTTNLGFDLYQAISAPAPGVGLLTQHYRITNLGAAPISFKMVRVFDGDLLWDGSFETDWVGMAVSTALGHPHVFMQEPSQPQQGVALGLDVTANDYFGGKHGVLPPNGPPAFGFGTDVQIWNTRMVPVSWRNLIAGLGYNTPGNSGSNPAGCTTPCDGFMGIESIGISCPEGDFIDLTYYIGYGSTDIILEETSVPVNIVAANPPTASANPYAPGQPFTDPLDTGTGPTLSAGIGAAGTPGQGPIQYSPLLVTFSGPPTPAPSPSNITVSCTGGSCPTVVGVTPVNATTFAIALSAAIPPLNCTTLTFVNGGHLQYRSNPGNVNLDFATNTGDLLSLVQALNSGAANQPSNLARYNVNRSNESPPVNTIDLLRLVQLLNGTNTTQVFNGTTAAACPP
ncbi:MAG TPA: hypothetical protein VGM03_05220 [Phycisphaerae bacterium]|jgi:hypothetical protein